MSVGARDITLGPVDLDMLPEYPLDRTARLLGSYFLKFETQRWLNSEMCLSCDREIGFIYLNLIFIAQHQVPIGTLPAQEELLAQLARCSLAEWRRFLRRDPNPLHRWQHCRCDGGEVRLMHPVVLEMVEDQLCRRAAREMSNASAAARQRLKRLRERMLAVGMPKQAADDDVLVERMDAWLAEHHRGRRDQAAYDRVFEVAARERWFALSRGGAMP